MTKLNEDLIDPIADPVLDSMYNWKFRKAYRNAENTQGFPTEALIILSSLADMFENCGWQEGYAFDLARDNNNKVAAILGYEWNKNQDFWIKIENSSVKTLAGWDYKDRTGKEKETILWESLFTSLPNFEEAKKIF